MRLESEITRVVANGNCTGCGGCEWLFPESVSMELDGEGFLRPSVRGQGSREDARRFRGMCPGVSVSEPTNVDAHVDEYFGPFVSAWRGWATDPVVRSLGSSGGVITAINDYVRLTKPHSRIIATTSSDTSPTTSVPLVLTTRAEIEASAGSRYAPVSNLASQRDLRADDILVGKPCEAAAVRNALLNDLFEGDAGPLLVSFFCAGTPSQNATMSLIEKLGVRPNEVTALRYRGNGWPGEFTVTDVAGRRESLSYHESWGGHLGRDLQWRCKICPHGTGNHADIAVGDFWRSDSNGYPLFESGDGDSVVIARTPRGHELLMKARADGVLLLEEIDLREVWQVQPLQTKRITTLWARLAGRILAGYRVPRYQGFDLFRRALRSPRLTVRTAVGTWIRSLRARIR